MRIGRGRRYGVDDTGHAEVSYPQYNE